MKTPVRVGIALIRRGSCFLIRQRPEGAAMPGFWEFPGGKCEPGESIEEATVREAREEIGVAIHLIGLRAEIEHRYPHAWVAMSFFDAALEDSFAEPVAGSGFVWREASDLSQLEFPGANEPILEALTREFG